MKFYSIRPLSNSRNQSSGPFYIEQHQYERTAAGQVQRALRLSPEDRELAKVIFFEMLHSPLSMEQEDKQAMEFRAVLCPILKEGIKNHELKGQMEPESLSSLLVSIYFQTVMNWLSFPGQVLDPVAVFMYHFEMVWERIGSSQKGGS
ncbi:hypothetical protein [Peribacillus sp. SCS-155]|uniref:hypothetical protein n=1 Tax=Peribacillus sedimenti TaxID=3115297 RepID=UPI003905D2FD